MGIFLPQMNANQRKWSQKITLSFLSADYADYADSHRLFRFLIRVIRGSIEAKRLDCLSYTQSGPRRFRFLPQTNTNQRKSVEISSPSSTIPGPLTFICG